MFYLSCIYRVLTNGTRIGKFLYKFLIFSSLFIIVNTLLELKIHHYSYINSATEDVNVVTA